jgi:polyhydroxyalkanoate synthesis regulator protein
MPGTDNTTMQADFWNQFLNFQQPAMQSMMTTYMDQSKKMFQNMQDQLQSQTRNMFTGLVVLPEKTEK